MYIYGLWMGSFYHFVQHINKYLKLKIFPKSVTYLRGATGEFALYYFILLYYFLGL